MDSAASLIDVEVLRRTIAISDDERRELSADLLPAERAQMAKFLRDADQRRFLVGRATLRRAAAKGVAPIDVPITVGPFGKLSVPGMDTNVSHSGDIVLVAVARGADVGIDVEHIDPKALPDRLDMFFSPREILEHLALPEDLRVASFFHIWTSKEAVIKAVATGLSLSLQAFDVAVDPREPPALLAARAPELARPMSLARIEVAPGHAAALAVCAPACSVVYA
ncbi:MAG TPA: 4'-phosphopantetheinyl transferase superfamily protein [Kofleriaceae bacterium]